MTTDELRALYTEAVKIAQAELKWRMHVWRDKPDILDAKTREIKRLLLILEQMKIALAVSIANQHDQLPLIDVPPRQRYD